MMMMMSTSTSMTDCSSSSMQGSTTSSASSDVMTLTTTAASSWCAMPASTRLRVVRLVRPHQRRLLVVPNERSATFGFAVRGGKEHGIGFFVSHVEHGGEAQLKGLRIGDQILRINGYRLEDAVHKEFIQLVASQDRITLKVRGVGMLPVKDQADERLSWSVVKLPSVSGTPSESSFKTMASTTNTGTSSTMGTNERTRSTATTSSTTTTTTASREINVVLHVAPRTKLGLGICKGPEWKPGIFVQFTKERSVAREAGLRPGDQILSVNSIDFSDVLFSEAVAVMKGSSKLDMVVRTAAGCDLFPGESSGYNSSASSVTGDQSPCWADAKSKRLTAVREEPINQQQSGNPGGIHKQLNKTIIKLTENGTSINNTYIANGNGCKDQLEHLTVSRSTTMRRSCSASAATAVAPAPPPPAAIMHHSNGNEGGGGGGGGGSSLSSAINEELKKRKEKQQLQQQQQQVGQHGGATRCNSHLSRERERGRERDRDRDRDHRSEDRHNNSSNNINGGSRNVAQVSHKRERNTSATRGAAVGGATTATGDQHTALMDEFKRAHQRMFRNGFHESEHKERNETLKRTSIMPDDSCYRNNNTNSNNNNNKSGNNNNINSNNKIIGNINGSNRMSLLNGNNSNNNASGTPELPPPPPQFANPLKLNIANGNASKSSKQLQASPASASTSQSTSQLTPTQPLSPVRSSPSINKGAGLRAPLTPQPDYDAAAPVQLRSNLTTPTTTATATTNGSQQQQQQQQRRTLRLGTVTIGEYGEQQRGGKRETLRKIPSINGGSASGSGSGSGAQTNGILKNGNRSSASFNNNNNNGNSNGNSNRQQMQQLEKTIKFGN